MELTLSFNKRMVCGKCGRELNKDAVIYYSDKSCDVYCCQCGEGKYTHLSLIHISYTVGNVGVLAVDAKIINDLVGYVILASLCSLDSIAF